MHLSGTELPALVSGIPGPRSEALADTLARVECPALTARRARRAERTGASRDPITWAQARGAVVQDVDGNRFVDTTGGFGVALLEHALPAVTAAVRGQAEQLVHALGDVCPSRPKIDLLRALTELAPWPARAMLGLTGAEAVEAALKTAQLATGRPGVVAFEGSYHGLSYGPLAACGYGERFRGPFEAQLNPHVTFVPYPAFETPVGEALQAVERAIKSLGGEAGCVLVEPIQGRGGVRVPPPHFLRGLGELCRARGLLLVVDEIYTGLGRTGAVWRHVEEGASADLICVGKALGGGLPVSACLGRAPVMAAWGEPAGEAIHTSTFSGNPLGCAAALATLGELSAAHDDGTLRDASQRLETGLRQVAERHGAGLRGAGLLWGYAPRNPAQVLPLVGALLERGYLCLPAGAPPEVLAFTPPACLTEAQLEGLCAALDDAAKATMP